ncbi:MAG TPA: cytochrome c, partial [Bacteroidetes bacterium]|nr:cytochrome c [Bacteroidota bacterium]
MKILLIIFTILTVFLIYGFKNIEDEESGKKQHKISGEELFQMNCAVCHGVDKQGKPPVFPSLVTVNERMNKEQVKELLQTGRK